ncbi:uronyl 2-sulfotransferase-like [Saccoglossus kowalevskii]|uniref:Uronyl 2-sulfotransferase-like n=1 Tax=Saccoglossus kowalevskii TaxID=10224 RepID=A0ABM0LUQ9_SACKO|nr:PREDICTED: uronyl 2-sulfotransferase-like [Saccoglossus kowalevskii]
MSKFQQYLRPTIGGVALACALVVLMVFTGSETIQKVTKYEPIHASSKSELNDSPPWLSLAQTEDGVEFDSDSEEKSYESATHTNEPNQQLQLSPQSRVVYNRVGKCGSRTVIAVLNKLSTRNGFTLYSSNVYNRTHVSLKEQIDIVNTVSSLKPPYVYQRHFHYIDFPKFGAIQPVYINIIRDPINRFVSGYYYKRFGDADNQKYMKKSFPSKNMTVDECVLLNKEECSDKKLFYMIPFFCGQHPYCSTPSQLALDRALSNLDKRFLVVGFIEKIDETMQVLEQLLPDIFGGAVEILLHPETSAKTNDTSSKNKIPPSSHVRTILRDRMKYEYMFYEAALSRFTYILRKLGIEKTKKRW